MAFAFGLSTFIQSAKFAGGSGGAARAKKVAVNYFSGNPSCANCDHVRRFLQARQMAGRAEESLNQLELVLLLLLLDLLLLLLPTKVTFSSPYSPQLGGEGRRSRSSLDHL